jgi:hypothetical protein
VQGTKVNLDLVIVDHIQKTLCVAASKYKSRHLKKLSTSINDCDDFDRSTSTSSLVTRLKEENDRLKR